MAFLRFSLLRHFSPSLFTALAVALISCGPSGHRDPVLGEAYVGPANLNLRKEITPKSATVAVIHFGDKVEIVGTRRRFLKVRTKAGLEGWTDDRMLLDQNDIDQIKAQSEAAKGYPSQAIATTYDLLNVHAQPNRFSPSYIQIKEGEKFDVLEHRLVKAPATSVRKQLVAAPPKAAKKAAKETKSKVPPPPAPKAPALPLDWLQLSKTGEDLEPRKIEEPAPTTPEEDWTLVRTVSGQSGWILSRRVYMAIPDEVAQYAEGRRITSYFPLGKVQDEDKVKTIWLWTTVDSPNHPYDFDGFRVFMWSLRRHRYETALIQRHLRGYFPTVVDPAAGTFAVCIEKEDGHRYRRSYRVVENVVRFAGEAACDLPKQVSGNAAAPVVQPGTPASAEKTFDKIKGKLKSMMKK